MSCDLFRDNLELYALGALESDEALALNEHLSTGCASCAEELRRAVGLNVRISQTVPLVDPPSSLQHRILASIAAPKASASHALRRWLPVALAAAAVLLLVFGVAVSERVRARRDQTAKAQFAYQQELSSAIEILNAPGTRAVSFSDPARPDLRGSLYIHQKLGLALIIDRLPSAPAGWKYESWVLPKNGRPQPVEPFHPDKAGRAVSVVPGPVPVADLAGVAVSMEPENTRPTQVTTLVFKAKI